MPNDLSSPVLDLPAATTAVLHGMMTTLSEVLGGIDGRIAALERQLREARAETGSPRALAQTVEAAVARLAERIEALEAVAVRPPQPDQALLAAVDGLRQTVEALAERPPFVDEALRRAVVELRDRPPFVDEALHAALAELRDRPVADDAPLLAELRAGLAEVQADVAALAARPVADEALHAAVAALATRPPFVDEALHAAVAELRDRPVRDEALHAAVAELRDRPVPDDAPLRAGLAEVRTALAELRDRPPFVDEALHAAVAELRDRPVPDDAPLRTGLAEVRAALEELAARPPFVDEALHAAVAEVRDRPVVDEALHGALATLAERVEALASLPTATAQLGERLAPLDGLEAALGEFRAALGELAARPPAVDQPLRQAVARLADHVANPAADHPLRAGVASLHERLNVLLDVVAQPPQPDDAVRAGLAAVEERLAALKTELEAALDEPEPEPAPAAPDPVLLEVAERLRQLEGRLAEAEVGDVRERLTEVAAALTDHPAARLVEAMDRMEQQVAAFVAQPGPGPAMAMVAAGLAERFESRTDGLVDLLTSLSRDLATVATTPAAIEALSEAASALPDAVASAAVAATAGLPDAITAATADLPGAIAAAAEHLGEAAAADRGDLLARFDQAVVDLGARLKALDRLDQLQRLDALEPLQEALQAGSADVAGRVQEFIAAQFAEVARREEAVGRAVTELRAAVEQSAAAPATDPVVAATLDRVRQVVEGQQGDVIALRDGVRGLVESVDRHGSISAQVAELLLENRAALAREIDRLQAALADQGDGAADHVRAAVAAAERMGGRVDAAAAELERSVAQVEQSVAQSLQAVRHDVQALVATGQDPAHLDALGERIAESVRRESELLTQRVAALSLAVENLRGMLDAHVEETANSIGRKAGEVGRRLAADLGIRTPKKPERSKPDRSLGPGAGS